MPEGDTILRAARTLHRALAGQVVTAFTPGFAQLATVDRETPLKGRTVEQVTAAGKHLLIHFSGGLVLRTHMRMNGSWHLYRPGERWKRSRLRARIVIETPAFVAVGFDVPVAEFVREEALARHPALRRLGPDLLQPGFDEAEALKRMEADPSRPAEAVLLDQKVMAGVGNVFKSEILFVCGVHPFDPIGALDEATRLALIRTAKAQLAANVQEATPERPLAYTGSRRTTRSANPAERLFVYGRGGAPCRRCGSAIAARPQGIDGRVTYWCPTCQPRRAPSG